MFFLADPKRGSIDAFLKEADRDTFSYSEIGATLHGASPSGYRNCDHNRIRLGKGEEDWEQAKELIRAWKMFDLGWARICWPETPIEPGRNVAMAASHLGFYSLNAARIVYTLNEDFRFGFAYGTRSDHAECGEERFSVDLDEQTGEVHYDLFSFSRPSHFAARLGYPYARYLQKRFVAHSKAVMRNGMLS